MKSNPLILRFELDEELFASQFLASNDFDLSALREICKRLNIPLASRKQDVLNNIGRFLRPNNFDSFGQVIVENLIQKSRKWFTFRTGEIRKLPNLKSPVDLVYSEGGAEWYGPYRMSIDDADWYIRPHFAVHWEIDETSSKPIKRHVRFLCFARVTKQIVSLHWQGFTISDTPDSIERRSQFPYWEHIPQFFDELEELLEANLENPNFHQLVLHHLWDRYRNKDGFIWTDTRIRAESGGVSLNARSSGSNTVVDLDVRGIQHLARTISLAVTRELGFIKLGSLRFCVEVPYMGGDFKQRHGSLQGQDKGAGKEL